jgi:putative transposase
LFTLCYPALYVTVEGDQLALPTGGGGKTGVCKRYSTRIARLTEPAPAHYREVAIARDALGHYSASFVAEHADAPAPPRTGDGGTLALDLGIKTLATGVNEQGRVSTSGGFTGHRWYHRQLDAIRSKRDRCQKQSRRYIHLSPVFQRVSERKRTTQRDCLHKASHLIASRLVASTVVIGDRSQPQMVTKAHQEQNHSRFRNRAVFTDGGLYGFVRMLADTCRHAGKQLELIDERYTTQECCRCHRRQAMPLMPLWKRTYRCGNPECRVLLDRDVNSALTILQRFLARLGPHTLSPDWLERAVCCAQVQQSTRLSTY